MPELEPKKSPLGDRNSVLKLVKRWKDFMLSEDTQIRFDKNVDPTKRDMQIRFKVSRGETSDRLTFISIFQQARIETGYEMERDLK